MVLPLAADMFDSVDGSASVTLQTLARHGDIAGLTAGYGLVVADECHHVPAAAFEDAVRQVRARRWLGLTATPYQRDKLDGLITLHVGPVRRVAAAPAHPQRPRQQPGQGGQHRPVSPVHLRPRVLPPQYGDLLTQHKQLGIFRRRRTRQQRHPASQADDIRYSIRTITST